MKHHAKWLLLGLAVASAAFVFSPARAVSNRSLPIANFCSTVPASRPDYDGAFRNPSGSSSMLVTCWIPISNAEAQGSTAVQVVVGDFGVAQSRRVSLEACTLNAGGVRSCRGLVSTRASSSDRQVLAVRRPWPVEGSRYEARVLLPPRMGSTMGKSLYGVFITGP